MGNCISHDNGKLVDQLKKHNLGLEGRDFVDFKVFIKQNKKFIPGTLRVCQNEIAFLRDKDNIQIWPLSYLRRYGYTCAGVFFFESGRRCATGEGLYTLQSHQAEKIFQCVQKRVQQNIDAYHSNSRASSVASNAHSIKKANSTAHYNNNLDKSFRIQPVQRHCSEGSRINGGNEYMCPFPNYQHNYTPSEPNDMLTQNNFSVHMNLFKTRPRSIATSAAHNSRTSYCTPSCHVMKPKSHSFKNNFHNSVSIFEDPLLEGQIISENFVGKKSKDAPSYPFANKESNDKPGIDKKKYHSYVNVSMLDSSDYLMNGYSGDFNSRGSASSCCHHHQPTIPYCHNNNSYQMNPSFYNSTSSSRYNSKCPAEYQKDKVHWQPPRPILNNPTYESESSRKQKCGSISQASDSSSNAGNPIINYALIDFDKNKLIENARPRSDQFQTSFLHERCE